MAQSNLDYIKERDKKTIEDHPWLPDFNYDERENPETIFGKIQKATHKIDIKKALETITSNSKSKLNVENQEQNITPKEDIGPLKVDTIITTGQEPNKENKNDITK